MVYLAVLIMCISFAAPVQATVDSDVDQIGVYFDLSGDQTCMEVEPHGFFSVYMIITNPTAPEVNSIAVSLCAEGEFLQLGQLWYGDWLGTVDQFCSGINIAFLEPLPFVDSNVPLVRVDYLLTGESEVEFFLRSLSYPYNPDGLPTYMDASGTVFPLGISSGDPDLPVALINGNCDVVSITGKTFGAVKSLFR